MSIEYKKLTEAELPVFIDMSRGTRSLCRRHFR